MPILPQVPPKIAARYPKLVLAIPSQIGRLTVIGYNGLVGISKTSTAKQQPCYECRCECGTVKTFPARNLVYNPSLSCGCLHSESVANRNYKHGESDTPLYRRWADMRKRCRNPKSTHFLSYGGRGIRVCDEWDKDFTAFRNWSNANGFAENLEIDRVNVDGDYSPDNCQWTTQLVNANNKTTTIYLTAFKETKSLGDWSRDNRCQVSYKLLKSRIRRGWLHLPSITVPVK